MAAEGQATSTHLVVGSAILRVLGVPVSGQCFARVRSLSGQYHDGLFFLFPRYSSLGVSRLDYAAAFVVYRGFYGDLFALSTRSAFYRQVFFRGFSYVVEGFQASGPSLHVQRGL